MITFCRNLLGDQNFYKKLQSIKLDLAIVDLFAGIRCQLILLYRLGVPYVGMTTDHEPWLSRSPALPSFVPFGMGSAFTERMTFWQRVTNFWELLEWNMFPQASCLEDSLVVKYAPDKPVVTLNYLSARCLLYLVNNDIILDYPRPLMPNEIFIGGSTHKPAQKLPKNLEEFVNSSPEGVILVSFGSFPLTLPESAFPKLLAAFKQLKLKVIWGSQLSPPNDVPHNVKFLHWIPQNDLLGHPKTKLFITHSGANGQFEALYHGVPMIAMPSFAEQTYNANRMVYHKFGLKMDIRNFEVEELLENIHKILGDKSYKDSIQKASQMYYIAVSHCFPPRRPFIG